VQRSNKGGKQRPEHDREPVKYLRHDSATGKREFTGAIAAATMKSPWERAGESVEAGEEEEEQMKRSEMGKSEKEMARWQRDTRCPSNEQKICVPANKETNMCLIAFLIIFGKLENFNVLERNY